MKKKLNKTLYGGSLRERLESDKIDEVYIFNKNIVELDNFIKNEKEYNVVIGKNNYKLYQIIDKFKVFSKNINNKESEYITDSIKIRDWGKKIIFYNEIKVLTYNIAWEAMKPVNSGFNDLGDECRKNVDLCRTNILNVIEDNNYDFIGIQEIPRNNENNEKIEWERLLDKYIKDKTLNWSKSGKEHMLTIWNYKKYGKPIITTDGDLNEKGRPFQILLFNNGILFVNIHAGHKNKNNSSVIKKALEDSLDKQYRNQIKKIIMVGDFNRDIGSKGEDPLTLFGKNMWNIPRPRPKTCCSQKNGSMFKQADHILYSEPNSYKVKSKILNPKYPASDHLPVMAILKIN